MHFLEFHFSELSTSFFWLGFIFSLVVTWQLLIVQLWYYIIWRTYVTGQHSTMQSLCVAIQTKLLCNPFSNMTSRMNTTGFALLFNCLLYAYPCILTTIKVNSTLKTCICWWIIRVNKKKLHFPLTDADDFSFSYSVYLAIHYHF